MSAIFWDKRARRYDDAIKEHDPQYVKTMEETMALLAKSDSVLDFGCGSGEISIGLASRVERILGIDTSGKMIELADEKACEQEIKNAVFREMDVFDSSLNNKSFSAIVAFNVFHLVDDAGKVLKRLHQLLTDKGLLISQTPCLGEKGWLFRTAVILAQKIGVAPYISNLTFPKLEQLVSGTDFEILETKCWDEKTAVQWIVARRK
jgi:2-polyprenyl-3-methyl-5-hydroxy-6-metoxy-1,4-benzoquinol methylase